MKSAIVGAALLTGLAGCSVPPEVMKDPAIVFVVWGDQPAPFEDDWKTLIADGVLNRLGEYGVWSASVGPTIRALPTLQPAVFSDLWVQHQMLDEIPLEANTIYVVVLPPGSSTDETQQAHSTGYHFLAVVPYAVVTPNEVLISHEIYEAATDPNGLGIRIGGQEVGDLCEGKYDTFGDITVQQVWSIARKSCL